MGRKITGIELQKYMMKLRTEDNVKCILCNDGTMKPVGKRELTHGFCCDKCRGKIDVD